MIILKSVGWLSSVVASTLLAATPFVFAEQAIRQQEKELFLIAQPMSGEGIPVGSFEVEIGNTNFWGIGFGYNFSNNVNGNLELFLGDTELTVMPLLGSDIEVQGDVMGMGVSVDYNILSTRLTPVATGGIGLLNFSGDLSGNTGTDFSETDFYYMAGAGVRWDVSDRWFVKALYKATWVKLGGLVIDSS